MKKKIAYTLIGLSIVLLIGYLLRYKQSLDLDDKIPSTATQVVNVDLRQIEHHIVIDFLKNPYTYISFKSSKKDKDSLSLFDAVSIPKNILLFTNNSNFKDVWLSTFLKVINETELSDYLTREGFKESKYEDLVLFNKSNFVFAVKNKRLMIAYRTTKEVGTIPVIKAVFDETDFLSESSELLKSIINSKSDISYANITNDFVEANFKKGVFEVFGSINSDLFLSENHEKLSQNSVAFLNARLNKNHKLFQSFITDKNNAKFKDLTKLSIDSITSKWNGNIAFDLKSIRSKTDTIITYEYDDDFNKIEKKSVQEIIIPDVNIELGTQSDLTEYLSSKNAIQVIENDTLFTSIPIYKFYGNASESKLAISTKKQLSKAPLKESKCRLNAHFDIEKYVQSPLDFSLLPTNNEYMQLLKSTSIELSDSNELSVKVKLKNTKRNFIGQLIKQ